MKVKPKLIELGDLEAILIKSRFGYEILITKPSVTVVLNQCV